MTLLKAQIMKKFVVYKIGIKNIFLPLLKLIYEATV